MKMDAVYLAPGPLLIKSELLEGGSRPALNGDVAPNGRRSFVSLLLGSKD